MVGSKFIYPNGILKEAGGIVWNNGDTISFGNLNKSDMPEYNYVKEVDFISGGSFIIRKTVWNKIGGFDEKFNPSYFENIDLAFELRKIGYKVIYQPKSIVIYYGEISIRKDIKSVINEYKLINKEKFIDKGKMN